jgi:hypothetical protein
MKIRERLRPLRTEGCRAANLTLAALALVMAISLQVLPNRTPDVAVREAVNKSLTLLQSSSSTFIKNAGCASCHSQSLALLTFTLARRSGFRTDEGVAREAVQTIIKRWAANRESLIEGREVPATIDGSYGLVALAATGYQADKTTDALVYFLEGEQAPDGHWRSISYRPPLEYSEFTGTALCVRALQLYAPKSHATEINARIKRARAWLIAAKSKTNEERVFRLLGLYWARADSAEVRSAALELVAKQRSDGGWSQLSTLGSDAYATGQALVALNETDSISVTSPIYRKGISYLRRTQFADGSWDVQSRSFPVIPFVASGFPHGKNQFISAAASNWATMALIKAFAPEGSHAF